jgi:hypothetical protein
MGHALGNNYGKSYGFQSKPVWLDLQFQVQAADTGGLGVTNVKGQGVSKVFMHTSATAAGGNPNPAVGLAVIQLEYNYTRMYCPNFRTRAPLTGAEIAINSTSLTVGQPYQITTLGAAASGAATIAPVADSSGSLASTWFNIYDAYGQTFTIWFSVSGVGTAPKNTGGILVQQSISTNDTAATIGAALVVTIGLLPIAPGSATYSFTAAGTTTVTITSTGTGLQLGGAPSDGTIATGFTFVLTKYTTNLTDWQKVGVPAGVVPQVGVSFIAIATGYTTGGASSGKVKAIDTSGIVQMEVVGDPNFSIAPIPMGGSPNSGGWFLVQFMAATSSSVTTLIPTAPKDGTIIQMTILLEQAARVGGNNE